LNLIRALCRPRPRAIDGTLQFQNLRVLGRANLQKLGGLVNQFCCTHAVFTSVSFREMQSGRMNTAANLSPGAIQDPAINSNLKFSHWANMSSCPISNAVEVGMLAK
jgi:hypothetical protein